MGPINEVIMQESTAIAKPEEANTEKYEDLRNPVGLDAGAPEVTDAAADEGGWHGGAEDDENKVQSEEVNDQAPLGLKVDTEVPTMGLDDDARKLAEEAMRADLDDTP